MIRIFHTTRHHISGHRGANLTRKCFPLKWFAECPFRSSKISTVKRPKVEDETIGWRKENWPIKYVNLLHFVMRVWFTDLPTFEQRWWDKRVLSNHKEGERKNKINYSYLFYFSFPLLYDFYTNLILYWFRPLFFYFSLVLFVYSFIHFRSVRLTSLQVVAAFQT